MLGAGHGMAADVLESVFFRYRKQCLADEAFGPRTSLSEIQLYKDELIDIFGKDLYEDETLLPIFKELIGDALTKPFECVGEIKEVRYALSKTISKLDNLPYLLEYYKDNYEMVDEPLESNYNENNNLPDEYAEILKERLVCLMK